MKRTAVRFIAGVLTASAALGGLLAWRLARGPIDMPLLTSYVARALSSEGGPTVRVRSTELIWDRHEDELRLRARDVAMSSPTGAPVGLVPSLTLGLSLRALLRGVIAPAEVVAQGVRLRLVLRPDGTVDLGLGEGGEGTFLSSPRTMADRLFGAPGAAPSAAWLRSVALDDVRIDLVDPTEGSSWQARDVDLVLRPAGTGLDAKLTGRLAFGPTLVPIRIEAAYRRDPERIEVALAFRRLDPSAVGSSMPPGSPAVLRFLSGLRFPIDGRIALTLDAALEPLRARLKLVGGPGTVRVAAVPGQALAIARLRAALTVDRDEDRIGLQLVSLDMGRGAVRVRGEVRGLHGLGSVDLAVSVTDVPVDEVSRYWPEEVAADARRWVVGNVRGGHVHSATIRVAGTVDDAVPTSLRLGTLTGSFLYDGLTVRYLPTMSPATGIAGTGTFSERGLSLRVARGTVGRLELVHATVRGPSGQGGRPTMAFDGSVRGALAEAMTLLEQEPSLALSRAIGVAPRDVAGTLTARVALAIPLRGATDLRAMRPTASATLRDLSVARLPRGWTLTDGDFTVELGGNAVAANGRGRVQGVALTLAGKGDLDGGRRTLEVRGDVGAAGFAAFGLDRLPRFDGEVAVQAQYAATRPGAAKLRFGLDLARIAIDSSAPALRKRAGAPGTARIDLGLSGDAVSTVDHLELDMGGTRMTGSATLSERGTRWQTIDARAVLAAPGVAGPPGRVTVKLGPERSHPRLTVTSDDAGALDGALGANFDMVGGRLLFAGNLDSAAPGWPIDGHLDVRSFTLTRAPILARVASLASLSGIASGLSGSQGIAFDRLSAELAHRGGVITIKSARASGASLGISVRGVVDGAAGTLALEGSLVPAYYGLNEAANRVPLVGRVFTGTRGEGIHVFDFEVRGAIAGPQVSVRPSSAAPGVIRDVLRLLQGRPAR